MGGDVRGTCSRVGVEEPRRGHVMGVDVRPTCTWVGVEELRRGRVMTVDARRREQRTMSPNRGEGT